VKRYIALLFALLVLVSCSEADPVAPSSAPPSNGATEEAAVGDDRKPKQGAGKPSNDKDQDEGEKESDGTPRRGARPSDDDDGSDEDGADSPSPFNDSGGEDDNSSAVYPAAGSYLYSQSGFEKFCSGGSCERQALPERQTARITLRSRTDEKAVVLTETSSSGDRMLRTTATFTRANSLITDVYTRLSYRGFAFENEYHPAPPVESLRFPLRDGARWSGSWEDSTSGDYSVQVFGPSSVTVNGGAVRVFQVATTTRFEGEFQGEAKTLTWVDPATKAIVKLSGAIDLTSTYGRYVTEFSSSLRSGPRY